MAYTISIHKVGRSSYSAFVTDDSKRGWDASAHCHTVMGKPWKRGYHHSYAEAKSCAEKWIAAAQTA